MKAALEGFANRYAALGLRLEEPDARALVIAVIRQEGPFRMPPDGEIDELSRMLISRIDDLAKTSVLSE